MKTLKLIVFVSILGLVSQSCHKGGPIGVKGKGSNVTETKKLDGFDRIHLSIDADIFYTQDSIYKVEVSAQQNILAILKVEVEHHTLKFEYRRNVWDHNKVKITVHAPDINEMTISGNGDITVQNDFKTTALELSTSGSGDIYFPSLTANSLKLTISGSGDMKISGGAVKSESLSISGFGDIDLEKVIAESCVAKVSGAGDIRVNVLESLDVNISGSGNVRYRGTPSITSTISGIGKLEHID